MSLRVQMRSVPAQSVGTRGPQADCQGVPMQSVGTSGPYACLKMRRTALLLEQFFDDLSQVATSHVELMQLAALIDDEE